MVPVGALVQATLDAPADPASCSGIDTEWSVPDGPVSTIALRVWVLAPTVSVQLTVTWSIPPLVTVAVGLANAR